MTSATTSSELGNSEFGAEGVGLLNSVGWVGAGVGVEVGVGVMVGLGVDDAVFEVVLDELVWV